MPPFDGNLLQMPPGMNPVLGDLASSAWQLPFGDRLPGLEPSQLAFGDIFQQLGVANAGDQTPAQFEDAFKTASDIDFTTQAQNQQSGRQPDFFLNAQGKMVKNPNAAPLKPGQPLNIEIQANAGDVAPELQGAIQSILDIFGKFHPNMPFPRTWQEVMEMLARAAGADADASGTDAGSMQRAAYNGGSGGGGGGGDAGYGGGGGGGGGGDVGYRGGGGGGRGGGGGDSGGGRTRENVAAVPWDGKSKGDTRLMSLSERAQGRQLWAETQFAGACEGGNLGCAASVSKILQEGGYNYANSAGVIDLSNQMKANGWTESTGAETAQPGDIIYADGGGTKQHIGIVGIDENGNKVIYNNQSSTGQWAMDPFNACSIISDYSPDQVHVLHAPINAVNM